MNTPFTDYERTKRRHTRLSRLEARAMERELEAALAAIPTVTEYGPDHVKRWCAFFIGAVVVLCLVMGCEQAPLDPELSNALTLEPINANGTPSENVVRMYAVLADDRHVIGCGWPDAACTCPPPPPPKEKPAKVYRMEYTPPVGLWGGVRW